MAFILHGSSSLLPSGIASHGHTHSHSHSHSHAHAHAASHMVNCDSESSSQSRATIRRLSNGMTPLLPQTELSLLADIGECTPPRTLSIANGLKHQHTKNCDDDTNNAHEELHEEQNVNLRAAMIHVIGDLVQSVGVFLAAVLIKFFPNAKIADPLCTILFSIIVIMTTVRLFKESVLVLIDAVPRGLNVAILKADLRRLHGVKSLHHLNVWNHSTDYRILMVHLVVDANADAARVLKDATNLSNSSKYNIKHATIQIERITTPTRSVIA